MNIINEIKENYTVTKEEPINFILDIKINKCEDGYTIDQTKYIENKLNENGINNMSEKINPFSDISVPGSNNILIDSTQFRSAISTLIHLSRCTRPDISFIVSHLSCKRNNPTKAEWKKVINIFRYLKGTKNYKLKFDNKCDTIAYSDASFAPDNIETKSVTGYIIYGRCSNLLEIQKQTITTGSATEAEFNTMADLIEKVIWHNNLNRELEDEALPTQIYTDNMFNLIILQNIKRTNSSRHFNIDLLFVMDYVKEDYINLSYINPSLMHADTLTKRVNNNILNYFIIDNTFEN